MVETRCGKTQCVRTITIVDKTSTDDTHQLGVTLVDSNIMLTPLSLDDAEEHLAGEDDIQVWAFDYPRGSTIDDVRDAIREWNRSWASQGAVRNFGIWDQATGTLAGNVEVRDLGAHKVNISYVVFATWRQKGIAERAVRMALAYAAQEMGARVASFGIREGNLGSLAVAGKLGAQEVSRQPNDEGSPSITLELDLATLTLV